MNLFMQCCRAANLYFILIAALQLIPGFSPTSWGTTVAPLAFVLLLNAVKEAIDDFKRNLSDRSVGTEAPPRSCVILHMPYFKCLNHLLKHKSLSLLKI